MSRVKIKKKTIFLSADGGGFWAQTFSLLPILREEYRLVFFLPVGSAFKGGVLYEDEEVIYLPKFQNVSNIKKAMFVRAIAISFLACLRCRPIGIVAVGSALIVPFSFYRKLLRFKIVYIESLTRVKSLSRVGEFLYRYRLYDQLYVQWESLSLKYPKATYAGKCL